ncbi:OmpH family outer membrane protein [Pontibaca methylaminivorans]|uniref:Periplasmic chaperone for outer membrane proteins Skp n=1 Tax=Pontibaca methylaminivorans TaxID=515897 RepID=A0A1R3WFN4_9RHOB|nr:OmpH family outer membrane protein [Pontibaca methylaminivorans]SIT76728.1 periplasmic chaperone for outer membrane proteins Skp [Pontibaca methylaminivorans]
MIRTGAAALALALATTTPAPAQEADGAILPESAILTVASDRLFIDSAYGQRVLNEIESEGTVLAAENRRIEAELMAEERELTQLRAEMEAEAFRRLADDFDAKVQRIRREQDAKARELGERQEQARSEFLGQVRPVLVALMRETGASIILERSSVFLSADSTDITDIAIGRIDASIGDGDGDGGGDGGGNAGDQSGDGAAAGADGNRDGAEDHPRDDGAAADRDSSSGAGSRDGDDSGGTGE